MQGRMERDQKNITKTKNVLNTYPKYLTDYYYYSLANKKTTSTQYIYINSIACFLRFLKEKSFDINKIQTFKDVKIQTINAYIEYLRYVKKDGREIERSESNKATRLYALRSFFDYLKIEKVITENPCDKNKLDIPKANKKITVVSLTPEEVMKVKENIMTGVGNERAVKKQANWKERDMAIIHLGFHTGLRVSALTEINLKDIDFKSHTIYVTEKGNKIKNIYIDINTENIIRKWIEKRKDLLKNSDEEALFISNEKKRISTAGVNLLIKKYTYNIDKKITPHKMRSTFATNIYEQTNDIYMVSELLGHASVKTTKRYACVSEKREREAINCIADLY